MVAMENMSEEEVRRYGPLPPDQAKRHRGGVCAGSGFRLEPLAPAAGCDSCCCGLEWMSQHVVQNLRTVGIYHATHSMHRWHAQDKGHSTGPPGATAVICARLPGDIHPQDYLFFCLHSSQEGAPCHLAYHLHPEPGPGMGPSVELIKSLGMQVLLTYFKDPKGVFPRRLAEKPELYKYCSTRRTALMAQCYGLGATC